MIIIQYISLFIVPIIAQQFPDAPSPHCNSKPIAKNFPLALGQIMTLDLSTFFTGYNMEISIQQGSDIATIQQQMTEQATGQYNLNGLINYDLRHQDNHWGNEFVLITNDSKYRTVIYYGSFPNKRGFPFIDSNLIVQQDESIVCFDAVVILDKTIIILDCSKKLANSYKNYFYYVDLMTGNVTNIVQNQIYVDFKIITKRKFLRYMDQKNQNHYLIRAYLGDGVDSQNSGNTYFEIFNAFDPFDLQIVGFWDRSILGLQQLKIMDIQIYMNQLYFLDYYFGIYRFNIDKGQDIQPIGFYRCKYFKRFSIYSEDLQQKFILALANQHSVHQINWNDLYNPIFITKYSLVQNTRVSQLIVNDNYVIVQGSVKTVSFYLIQQQLYYTWVFTRNSRVYTDIFKIIDHPSNEVFIEFDRGYNYLLTIDQNGFRNFQLKKPILTLKSNATQINKSIVVQFLAISKDFKNPNKQYCTEKTIVHYVSQKNMSIWDTGIDTSEDLYANYPGQLIIDLQKYAFGPNITFQYQKALYAKYQPQHYVLKQNKTYLTRKGPIPIGGVTYLKTDLQQRYGNNTILAYYQDSMNNTYVSICVNQWFTSNITCTVQSQFKHNSSINVLTTVLLPSPFGGRYIYIFNLNGRSQIKMFFFSTDNQYATINYPSGYEGKISDLDVSGNYLYVTLPSIKRIDVYDLSQCDYLKCQLYFSLDANLMKSVGVQYFAPRYITLTRQHPEVLFIKTFDSVLIVDIDNKMKVNVLYQLISYTTKRMNFQIAVNKQYLVIVSAPNSIDQYKFVNLYKGDIVFHKNLPLYNYIIQDNFDLEFNDYGNLFYITATDSNSLLSVILVYKLGFPLVMSLYDVLYLPGTFKHDDLQLQVSGGYVDFVTVIARGNFYIYKEFEKPNMVIRDIQQSFSFYIRISNSQSSQNISLVKVLISNYPDNFNKSSGFPNPALRFIKNKINDEFTWSDRNWFQGHILNNYYKCLQCPNKIELQNHIHRILQLQLIAQDYVRTQTGGFLLWDDIFRLYPNSSVRSIQTLPRTDLTTQQMCLKVVSPSQMFAISVCANDQSIKIYLTSYVGRKGFTMGPYISNAKSLVNLQTVKQIFMIVDVDINLNSMSRSGGVFIYSLSLDVNNFDRFQEIEYIDTNDLANAHGWDRTKDVYVGNAHLMYIQKTNHYRMYLTEIKNGLFVLNFRWQNGNEQISLISVDYINLNDQIAKLNFHMPSDATYQALTHISVIQNDHFQIETILVTTNNYHNFQFYLVYSQGGRLISCGLHKVYYRYGYYNTYNYVKAFNGFIAIPYVIPPIQQIISNYSRQIIALYDTSDYEGDSAKGYSERYIIAGQILNKVTPTNFEFNISRNQTTGRVKTGLVIINPEDKNIIQAQINKNLTIKVSDPQFQTQNMFIWPYSDFYRDFYELKLIGIPDNSLKGWQIFLIVLGSVLFSALISFGIYKGFMKWKLLKKKSYLLEQDQQLDDQNLNEQLQQQKYQRLQVNESIQIKQQQNIEQKKQNINEQNEESEQTALQNKQINKIQLANDDKTEVEQKKDYEQIVKDVQVISEDKQAQKLIKQTQNNQNVQNKVK